MHTDKRKALTVPPGVHRVGVRLFRLTGWEATCLGRKKQSGTVAPGGLAYTWSCAAWKGGHTWDKPVWAPQQALPLPSSQPLLLGGPGGWSSWPEQGSCVVPRNAELWGRLPWQRLCPQCSKPPGGPPSHWSLRRPPINDPPLFPSSAPFPGTPRAKPKPLTTPATGGAFESRSAR